MKRGEWCIAHGWQWLEWEAADMGQRMEVVGHIMLDYDAHTDTLRIWSHPLDVTSATETEIRAMDAEIRAVYVERHAKRGGK
jgi:hypothetical protein